MKHSGITEKIRLDYDKRTEFETANYDRERMLIYPTISPPTDKKLSIFIHKKLQTLQ